MVSKMTGTQRTIAACFTGYIAQACVCTFAPLLYVRFQTEFALSLQQVASLVTLTFLVQLLMDILCTTFVDRIGYRPCVVAAHVLCALGFVSMAVLPGILPSPYAALAIAVAIYSMGAGIIEVLISPIIESCPTQRKAAMMNLLHSFFGWGQALVAMISTAFFALFGLKNWRILAILWAILPAVNAYIFTKVPIPTPASDAAPRKSPRRLLSMRMFWLLFILMVCSGASELAVSQWASALIETELGVSKTVGDLMGICLFGVCMGVGRLLATRFDDDSLELLINMAGILCVVSYLLIALAPWPWLSLFGCALCGLSVSVMWPSGVSLATRTIPGGGTALFALLAFAGDIGCTVGPTWAGFCAGAFGDDLKIGILFALLFPVLLLLILRLVRLETNRLNRFR